MAAPLDCLWDRAPLRIDAAAGDSLCALLRPERIQLHPAGHDGGVQARVAECVYHGQSVRYHLRLDCQQELLAVAADRVPRFAVGDQVRAAWSPADVWIVPDRALPAGDATT